MQPSDGLSTDLQRHEAIWRRMIAEYDSFYTEHIDAILSEDAKCILKLAKMRRDIDGQLKIVAACRIASPREAGRLLTIVLEVGGLGEHTASYHAAQNVAAYLAAGAIHAA